jgi:hypothetical protein
MIVLDRRVIVHVVAAEIGEAAGRELHAVEAALVETMAGSLHRCMGDAGVGQFLEQPVQRHRIGRGQRAILVPARRHHTGSADGSGGKTCLLPYLPCEGGDRSLAAGAGHSDHGLRLPPEEARGTQRQRKGADRRRKNRGRETGKPLDPAATIAAAPRLAASAAKLVPSALVPASEKDDARSYLARSDEMPVTSRSGKLFPRQAGYRLDLSAHQNPFIATK